MLGIYLVATPWAVPLTALAGFVLLLVTPWLANRLALPRWLVLWAGLSWVAFLAVTATPSEMPWVRTEAGLGETALFSLDVEPIGWAALGEISERSLNVWLAVPLGFFAVLVALRRRRVLPVLLAAAAPFAVESLQALVPQLGRAGFLLADAVLNLTGLLLGGLTALAAALLVTVLGAPFRALARSRHGRAGGAGPRSAARSGTPVSGPGRR